MPSLVHRLTVIAVYVALLMATAWLLEQMARWQFTAYLRDQAAHALVLAARADTPYRWDYHPDNIIAGRVFGDASFDFTDDCLLVDSLGQPFEIGLRFNQPLHTLPEEQVAD